MLELIREMTATGATVVMCTHLLLEAEGLADQVVVLEDGHALVSGTPNELTERYWPGAVVRLDAEQPSTLDRLAHAEGVLTYERTDGSPAMVQLDDMSRVPDLVHTLALDGVRLTRVEPHTPTLEDLYFAVRGRSRPEAGVVPRDETPIDEPPTARAATASAAGSGIRSRLLRRDDDRSRARRSARPTTTRIDRADARSTGVRSGQWRAPTCAS